MAQDGGRGAGPLDYQREQGMLGALLLFGRPGLDAARAAGWSPELARRPQIAALGAWLVEGIEAGRIVDLATAIGCYQAEPPAHRDAPPFGEAIQILFAAPNVGPVSVEDIPAHVRLMIVARQTDRLSELRAALDAALRAGDIEAAGRVGAQIAALTAAPKAPRSKPASSPADDRQRDPATRAALQAMSKAARDDDRLRARLVFTTDPRWAGQVWYDAMRGRQMRGERPWADHDDHDAALWISEVYGVRVSSGAAREVLAGVAQADRRHPLQDWLRGLTWDGVQRADLWLYYGLGVEDSPLTRAISRRWLIQAAARAMRPGCQADATLVLVGEQGRHKSSVVRALAGTAFFSESPIDLHGDMSDVVSLVHSAWIHDMSEGTDVRRADVDRLKQFLTTRTDITRRKYARTHEERPRAAVFTVTTNDNRFIPADPSGARRFWPVQCQQGDVAWIDAHRDQLWAEAMVLLANGEQWHLTAEECEALVEHQADFEQDDATRSRVRRWLREADIAARYWVYGERNGREPLTTEAVMTGPMGLDLREISKRQNEMRAGDILRKLGFVRRRVRVGRDLDWGYTPGGMQDET